MSPNAEEFNEDELNPPKWLDENFFLDVLKNAECSEDHIQLKSIKITPATVKGDHYASVMFRARAFYSLNGEHKERSMILKTLPDYDGHKKDMLGDSHIFETEIGMYTEVIPKFESMLRAAGDNTCLGAKCIYYSLTPQKVIIFEDIVENGYEVLRGRPMTFEEIKATYSNLAKWHAVSHKLLAEEPKFFDKYRHGLFNNPAFRESPHIMDSAANFIEMLDKHDDLRMYKKYFEPMKDTAVSDCEKAFSDYRNSPDISAIYVLCHGDFHAKNMMYKRNAETGTLEDVMLLDYQMSYVGPIGNDLLYSKFLLLSQEQRHEHFDEILYDYFKVFQQTLKSIEFSGKIPTIMELRRQLCRHKNFEFFLMFCFLPIWDSFADGNLDVDEMFNSAEARKEPYKRQIYIDEVRRLLPKYLYNGYLEI